MPSRARIKTVLVVLLVGAAALGRQTQSPLMVVGLLAFGVFNAVVDAPGTGFVRAVGLAGTFAALLLPGVAVLLALLAWLTWPPAFIVGWALAGESGSADASEEGAPGRDALRARIAVATVIVAVAIASLAYRAIMWNGLQQTAALFVGIPALLAVVVVFGVPPRSAVGVAVKAVTVGLLVSLLFLGEGLLCVAMSAPLFYAVAVAIARAMQWGAEPEKAGARFFSFVFVLAFVPMSLEGVTSLTTIDRGASITQSKIVRAEPDAIRRALFEPPRFERVLPLYLRAGFPQAIGTRIERRPDATYWVVTIRGGEMRLNGMEPRSGELVLRLEEQRPGYVRWRAVSDTSHTTHFLTWQDIVVEWSKAGDCRTKVSWTLGYQRGLDPAWYFGPWERYAVTLAAMYLIDTVATP